MRIGYPHGRFAVLTERGPVLVIATYAECCAYAERMHGYRYILDGASVVREWEGYYERNEPNAGPLFP